MKRGAAAVVWVAMVGLSGCAGFFPSTSSTSTTTTSTTALAGEYAYVVNPTANTISAYAVDTGALSLVSGSPYTLASSNIAARAVAISGANTFVYVAGTGAIYGYTIGSSGALTAISSGAILASQTVVSLVASPDGNWLLGLDGNTTVVDVYSINTSSGLLTLNSTVNYQPSGTTYTTTPQPTAICMSPGAGLVAASLGDAGDALFTFTTSASTPLVYTQGILTVLSTVSHNAVVMDSNNNLYIGSSGYNGSTSANGVYVYSVTSAGALATSTYTNFYTTSSDVHSLALSTSGGYLYAGSEVGDEVFEYSVASGVLSALTPAYVGTNAAVTSMARDKSGNYIVVGSVSSSTFDTAMYQISPTTAGELGGVAVELTGTDAAGALVAVTR